MNTRWYSIAASKAVAMKAMLITKAHYASKKTSPPFLGNSLRSVENCLKRLPEDPLELMVGLYNYYVIYFDEKRLFGGTRICKDCGIRPLTDEEREFAINHQKEDLRRWFPILDEDLKLKNNSHFSLD